VTFCAEHDIVSDVETVDMQDVNAAYDRLEKNDVRYRFVITWLRSKVPLPDLRATDKKELRQ
jgi:hypothetical protein